jgi:hypothetical protein
MPTYALLGADLYLPPACAHGGGEGQKAQEKLASRSSLFLQRCRGRNNHATSYEFPQTHTTSYIVLHFSYTVHCKGERRKS